MSHERLYRKHRVLIERTIARICKWKMLTAPDAADFAQEARMKLMKPGVLEKVQRQRSPERYLRMMLQNLHRDLRNKEWGKWRASIEAQRNGPVAMKLEELMVRDGLTFEEAYETLRTNYRVTLSRKQLEDLAARLPLRVTRRPQGEGVLVVVPDRAPTPDAVLSREHHQELVARVRRVLLEALRDLDPEDRLLIKLRYIDGLKVVDIARLLKTDVKPLYRRIEELLRDLKATLEAEGIDSKRLFDDEEPWE